jgi:hypothetical protein
MTTTTETPTVDAVLEQLEHDLAALPSDDVFQRQLDDLRQKRGALEVRIVAIRSATATLANLEPQIAANQKWFDHLTDWRKQLCDELLALPPRIRDERTLAVQQNLKLSIIKIDRGLDPGSYGHLRLDDLMAADGYTMPIPAYAQSDNSDKAAQDRIAVRSANWAGCLPDVEKRLTALRQQQLAAQQKLDEAILTDAERDRRATERRAAFNATPQRKTRGDGSKYDRYPDGREVEVTS